ncbi:hypothetical protein Tco_0610534 [Tanacetum coccineum]
MASTTAHYQMGVKIELVEDTEDESLDSDTKREGSEDEGPSSEEEEATPEGQQQAVPVMDTTVDEPFSHGYRALRRGRLALGEGSMPSTFEIGQSSRSVSEQQRVEETPAPRPHVCATWVDPVDVTVYTDIPIYVPPVRVPVQTPPSPEWSSGSLLVSPSSLAVPTPVASPVDSSPIASPATVVIHNLSRIDSEVQSFHKIPDYEFVHIYYTIYFFEAVRFLAEVKGQGRVRRRVDYDRTQRLDVLPPALFEGYDRDFRELYTRSRAVRDEIFSQ